MWEKEKLLVTSNFSFSHSVFKRLVLQTRKNQGLFGKGLKGRLPQKLQSKSPLSCEIVQTHSLFRHGFIKKPKWKKDVFCFYVTDFEKQILVLI